MDVALVGLVAPDLENHSLSALKRALAAADRTSTLVSFRGWMDLDIAVDALLRARPRVCGISIQSTESSVSSLALARTLRRRGFRGVIVCGGHFATLNAEGILDAPAGVDAVVRFAGEEAIVALASAASNDAWARVPGLVYRDRDGAIRHGQSARLVSPIAPARSGTTLPRHLDFPAADLIASRGCEARCAYCCVAGASRIAAREAALESHGPSGQRSTDPPSGQPSEDPDVRASSYARRDLTAVADEIALLWHEAGARVFNFMDDNILPLDAGGAASWARDLARALAARGAGRIAFSMQLRADVVTPGVVDALVDAGLVRAYVGIDGYSRRHLRTLGRRSPEGAGAASLAYLFERGVYAVCNALIVGPTFAFESILAEIDGIERIRHAPVHLLKLDVRAGSAYFDIARARGLLEGGPLMWHYRFEDERSEAFGAFVTSLPTRLAERSVPMALYDLGYNLGVARRHLPRLELEDIHATYVRVTEQWNTDQVRLLRLAADLAGKRDRAGLAMLRDRELPYLRAFDGALIDACDRALVKMERAVSRVRGRPVRGHSRSRILSAIAMSMGLSACGSTSARLLSSPGDDAGIGDAGDGSTGPTSDVVTDDTSTDASTGCVDDAGQSCLPSFSSAGSSAMAACDFECNAANVLVATFDDGGTVIEVKAGDGGTLPASARDCLLGLLSRYRYPSLAGTRQEFHPHCWIA